VQGENDAAKKQEMMGRQEWEMMGRDVLSSINFIGVANDRVMIRFPRKRCLSVSTTRVIRTRNRGAKRLEV
jgi:hypothetical protein